MSYAETPRFISFEGIDGAGKSTHIEPLARFMREQGIEVVVTREPGGTPLGESLRALVLEHPMDASAETLLMFAARFEHVTEVIRPALAAGKWVLSDRFSDASFAYQCGGRGVDWKHLEYLEQWLGVKPDLTFFFDLSPEAAKARVEGAQRQQDRFEREQAEFFDRVRSGYERRLSEHPNRICRLDSSEPPLQVFEQLLAVFRERLL
jgi:dTMP kinase